MSVLNSISTLVNEWQTRYATTVKKIPLTEIRPSAVHSFGSFKMGIHFPQTDMDLICVLPSYISKDDFFTDFMRVLAKDVPEVEDVLDVIDSRVPILKLKYMEF